MSGKEINKRVIENFIKAGAFDSLEGSRRQLMLIYVQVMDSVNQENKTSISGQMSLFDLVGEEEKKAFEIRLPDVEEYDKETLLAFEKEVLGIYVSGHPLDNYRSILEKNITASTADFQPDETTGTAKVRDGEKVVLGGMIADKTIKYTKNNKVMAFLTLEDLVGTVEVVVFPRDYEKNQQFMKEEEKVFIQGRVSAEDEKASKLICEKIRSFREIPREVWIQFADMETFRRSEQELYQDLMDSEGDSSVVIYLKDVKAMKRLPAGRNILADNGTVDFLRKKYGKENVKVVERVLKKF